MIYLFSVHELELPQDTGMSTVHPLDLFRDSVPILGQAKKGTIKRFENVELLFTNVCISKVSLEA
jgi:hypothetical protein